MKKPRVLVVSSNPPMNEMGGCLLFYRKFVERDDYTFAVVTNRVDYPGHGEPWLLVREPAWLQRLSRTRFANFAHDYRHALLGHRIPAEVKSFARSFAPDVIIMGAHNWMGDLGLALGRYLRVPVAGHFMDWASYAALGHRWMVHHLSSIYRKRYRRCDLAFGICPEMLETLGPHPNTEVFYPSGKSLDPPPAPRTRDDHEPFTLFFGGNLGQWYGHALAELGELLRSEPGLALRVAGKHPSWSEAANERMSREGEFLGYLDKRAYRMEMERADALLVIMGFDEESRVVESTSFKSKLVDYLQLGRPVIVWGPDYCTAVRHAEREGFAAMVTTPDPREVVSVLRKLADEPARAREIVEAGHRFFNGYLDADKVMGRARAAIGRLLEKPEPKWKKP
jgi:hypothetical protein